MNQTVEYFGGDGESVIVLPRLSNMKEQKKLEVNVLGSDVEKQLTKYAAEERFKKCPACTLCYYKLKCAKFFKNYPNDTEICERYTEKYLFEDGGVYTQKLCEDGKE